MELIQQIKNLPFFRILLPLIAGILFREYYNIQFIHIPFILSILLICILLIQVFTIKNSGQRHNYLSIHGMLVLLFFFFTGIYFHHLQEQSNIAEGIEPGMKATWSGVVYDYPVNQENSTRVLLHLESMADSGVIKPVKAQIVGFISNTDSTKLLKPGDRLIFYSTLYQIRNAGNPEEFDFQKYFKRKGIQYLTFIDPTNYVIKGKGCNFCLYRRAFEIRMALAAILESHLEEDNAPVAQAMVLGLRDSITTEVKEGFAAAGIMHILAISGLHVGILFLVLSNLWHWVTFSKTNRFGKALFVIMGIWGYAFLTGFPPSVIRATLMLSLFLIGDAIGRKYLAINSVLMAAFILLIMNPSLLFDISFQLSFTAVLGILILYPRIVRFYQPRNKFVKYFWQIICISVSAQIGTLPVSLYYFKLFPTLFLFANLIAIPAAFLIVLGSLVMFFSSWYPLICGFFGDIVDLGIEGLVKVGVFIDGIIFSKIENIHLSITQSFLLYALIASIIAFFVFKHFSYLKMTTLVILLLLLSSLEGYLFSSQGMLLLNHDPQLVLVSEKQGQVITLSKESISKEESEDLNYLLSYYAKYNKLTQPLPANNQMMLQFTQQEGNLNPVFLRKEKINKSTSEKLYTERIIVLGEKPPPINELLEYIDFDLVVFHASVPYYYVKKQKVICDEMGLPYHDLALDGAYHF